MHVLHNYFRILFADNESFEVIEEKFVTSNCSEKWNLAPVSYFYYVKFILLEILRENVTGNN